MTFAQFASLYPAQFREALRDLSLVEVAGLLDAKDLTELGVRIAKSLEGAKEDAELMEGFDPAESANDVVEESRRADAAYHNRVIRR